MDLCLYQPEIPQNLGTILRLGACMGVGVIVIEPCGFVVSDRRLRRAGMDYMDHVSLNFVESWEAFVDRYSKRRWVAVTPHINCNYTHFSFHKDDILILGQEGTGFPPSILDQIENQVSIIMQPQMRSLNVAVAGAMVLGEALRQNGSLL